MKTLWVVTLSACLATACASKTDSAGSIPQEKEAATKAKETKEAKALLVDVRTPGEHKLEHLPGAVNVPVNEVEQKIAQVAPDKSTPLMVHCAAGARSARAKAKLDAMGYTDVRDLGSYEHARQVVEGK